MQFRDRTLLALADPDERAAVLTPEVGDRVLAAAYSFDHVAIGPVSALDVRSATLLPVGGEEPRLDARVFDPGSGRHWEVAAHIRGAQPRIGADAQLDLLITATRLGVETSVVEVGTDDLGDLADLAAVDARIVAEDGDLPPAGPGLDERRFTALRTMVTERFETAGEVDLDKVLDGHGLTSLTELLTFLRPPNLPQRLRLLLVSDSTPPPVSKTFRVVAAAQIVESLETLADELSAVQLGRARVASGADPPASPPGMSARTPVPYLLMVPVTAFDDDDLPVPAGTTPTTPEEARAARLDELATRLRPLGVAPVAV